MKKFLLAILIAVTPTVLFACGDDTKISTDGEERSVEKMTGIVRQLGASIYQQGTHRLEQDGTLVALLEASGPQIKLDNFVGKTVEAEGIVSSTVEGNLQIMKVLAITPEGRATEGRPTSYAVYTDDQFGFMVKYPDELEAQQTRRGAAFKDSDEKIIEVVILENPSKQELADWLIDNYGYTADALRRVSIAGLVGYQFQNTTGSVIYLGSEDKVFTLAWYDNSETNRARNRRYYLEFVQSFSVPGVTSTEVIVQSESGTPVANSGEFCGGVGAIQCSAGLECRLSGSYPDAGGICVEAQTTGTPQLAVTSDQIPENEELQEISAAELQRGWYYGDRDGKKPGTPVTWILVDSGTRSAMWRRIDNAPAEPTIELPDATAVPSQLSTTQQAVLDYLKENINALAPEEAPTGEWSVFQLAFADPNFVYAVFTSGNTLAEKQTRRLLFVYTVVEGSVTTEMQAYFKPGTEQDWLVIEGADTAFGKAQQIVNTSGEITSNIVEGYRLFIDTGNGFQLQYPKDWYWRKPVAGRIEFSDKPFPAGIPLLTVKIVADADYEFKKLIEEDGQKMMYLAFDEVKSILVSAVEGYDEVLLTATQTFDLR